MIASLLLYAGWLAVVVALVSALRGRGRAPWAWLAAGMALWTVEDALVKPWYWAVIAGVGCVYSARQWRQAGKRREAEDA